MGHTSLYLSHTNFDHSYYQRMRALKFSVNRVWIRHCSAKFCAI